MLNASSFRIVCPVIGRTLRDPIDAVAGGQAIQEAVGSMAPAEPNRLEGESRAPQRFSDVQVG
jgi:hypothetical protein